MGMTRNADGKDDKIAALLAQDATCDRIEQELGVNGGRIKRVRTEHGIALPPGRAKRPKTELDALEQDAIRMLREGATYRQIRAATRFTPNRIAQIRKDHNIPIPKRQYARRTLDEAFARNTRPTDDGHLLWTGPRHGRHIEVKADGTTYNARHVAFRKHHGRDPIAYTIRTCDHPDCIAGAHHADQTIRRNNLRTNP